MLIRAAVPADSLAMAEVQVQSWLETYTGLLPETTVTKLSLTQRQAMWEKAFSLGQYIVVAEMDGRVVGFANGGKNRSAELVYPGELYAMYVLGAYHRRGVGAALLGDVKRYLSSQQLVPFSLYVLAENPAAEFYRRMGGVQVGEQLAEYDGHAVRKLLMAWE